MQLDLYREELNLEREMIQYGEERYRKEILNAEEHGRGSETSYARKLLSVICKDLAAVIDIYVHEQAKGVGKRSNARMVLRKLSAEQAAYITLKSIFDSLVKEDPLISIALTIGQRIEDQIRFTQFQEEVPDLYNHIIKEFKERSVIDYRRKHRVLGNAHSRVIEWLGLTSNQRVQLGTQLIEFAIKATGLFDVKLVRMADGKTPKILFATPETLEWIEEHISRFALLYPDFAPTVIPPRPWTDMYNGGYYLQPLRRRLSFVKTKSKLSRNAIKLHDYSESMQAVNKIQETPWRINAGILETMQEVWRRNLRIGMPPSEPYQIPECPYPKTLTKEFMTPEELVKFKFWKKECADLYTLEKTRVSKCMLLGRILSSAMKYTKYEAFYFVYNCDFRGRIYAASSGFSPQGPDLSKGILEFSRGKALGEHGFKWLCVHGANLFGFNKATFEDRYKWVLERKEQIIQIGLDAFSPGATTVWGDADEPYQFLAFCREFAQAVNDPKGFVSHLPIALDGSCNGLQHFSAMLRDEVGGAAVNLIPADLPQDIYAEVATVCTNKLKALEGTDDDIDGHAHKCLVFGVSRKITKKPVMILPYGGTQRNCLNKTLEFIKEYPDTSIWLEEEIYPGAILLGNTIWNSIGDVVIAARAAMTWLRSTSNIVSKLNEPLIWDTASGFYVFMSTMELKATKIKTQLLGQIMLTLVTDTIDVDGNKQANGFSPNFVHSNDAAHLVMTVNASNLDSYAMIHDSYGTHACDVDELAYVLREQFIRLYTEHDVLAELKSSLEQRYHIELPELPALGKLDINRVRDSLYFFG